MAHVTSAERDRRLRICREMAERGATQKEAALACGIVSAALSRWLADNGGIEMARRLAANGVERNRERGRAQLDPLSKRQVRLSRRRKKAGGEREGQ